GDRAFYPYVPGAADRCLWPPQNEAHAIRNRPAERIGPTVRRIAARRDLRRDPVVHVGAGSDRASLSGPILVAPSPLERVATQKMEEARVRKAGRRSSQSGLAELHFPHLFRLWRCPKLDGRTSVVCRFGIPLLDGNRPYDFLIAANGQLKIGHPG